MASDPSCGLDRINHAASSPSRDGLAGVDLTDGKQAAHPHEQRDLTVLTDGTRDHRDGTPDPDVDAWLGTAPMDELRARYGAEFDEPDAERRAFTGEEPPRPAFVGKEPPA